MGIDEIMEKCMELTENASYTSSEICINKNDKSRDLNAKIMELKQIINGLNEDITSITIGFQQPSLSSTKELAANQNKQQNEKKKMGQVINNLKQEKDESIEEYKQYKNEI